jgi:dolichol-phosphate mannosyltransferase
MELCILIPAKNEENALDLTVLDIYKKLNNIIPFNVLVINDYSDDQTESVLKNLSNTLNNFSYLNNILEKGVGNAINFGLQNWKGDIIVICMADASDCPEDILFSYNKLVEESYDCIFGSRFIEGSSVSNYPFLKKILNRLFNNFVKFVSRNDYNDFTNIFKMYSRKAIHEISPIESTRFSIGLEMSLKAFSKKMKIGVIPISWKQRTSGKSKLNILMNIRIYFSILLKCMKYDKKR